MEYEGRFHTKCFLPASDEKKFNELINIDWNSISRVVGALGVEQAYKKDATFGHILMYLWGE